MTDSLRPSAEAAIVSAAFEMLVDNPAASLGEIAKRAGVGRATLHRHFSNREALILALTHAAIEEMDLAVDTACDGATTSSNALYLCLEALVPLGDRYRFLASEPLDDHPDIASEFDRQDREMLELVEEAKQEGLFDLSIPPRWIVTCFEHLLYAAWESVTKQVSTPSQATELAWRTLINGLGAKP
jgi:AcrR family transcriptional regulator